MGPRPRSWRFLGLASGISEEPSQKPVATTAISLSDMEGKIFWGGGQSRFTFAGDTRSSYRLLEEVPLLQGEGVRLGDDRHDVDHLTEAPHELHIQRPQTGKIRKTLNAQT